MTTEKELLDNSEDKIRSKDDNYYGFFSKEMQGLGLECLTAEGSELFVAEHCRTSFVLRNKHMIDDCFIDLLLNHPVFTTARFWLNNRYKSDEQILDLLLEQPSDELIRREKLYSKLPALKGYTDNQVNFASSIRFNMLDRLPDVEVDDALIGQMNANPHTSKAEFWINIRNFKFENIKKFAIGEKSYDKYIQDKTSKKKKKKALQAAKAKKEALILKTANSEVRKLDIPKKDFLAFSKYVMNERGYKSGWQWVVFKANYGEWVSRSVRFTDGVEVEPKEPTKDYLDWLYDYNCKQD